MSMYDVNIESKQNDINEIKTYSTYAKEIY